MKHLIIISTFFILIGKVSAWTSSNEGVCYTMDTLCILSDSISYNEVDQMFEVDCNIVILENDTLQIYPGEIVMFFQYFPPGNTIRFSIEIYGCLLAIGTEENQINLGDPNSSIGTGNWWGGILFFNTSHNGESKIKHCNLRGITNLEYDFETAIYCENSSPIIDHTSFTYMMSIQETGGCAAIGLREESHPIISYCSFQSITHGVAVWSNINWYNDTILGPNPLIFGCNFHSSVGSFVGYGCFNDYVVIRGGFLDNCYFGNPWYNFPDTTLGFPVDTIGDGIKTTTSTLEKGRFFMVDGVINPRSNDIITEVNENEIDILPTTSQYLTLKNNYPNPFSSFTTIEFEVTSQQALINLYIFDSKGNCIKQLIKNSKYTAGTHQIKWNADNDNYKKVNPGIYFYKLLNNDQLQVKKAIVVKN